MKKIFIIVPVYNCEKYIDRCIESLLKQTIKEIQIICVDDGSTDRSYELLKKYSDRIILLHKNNGGLSSARNYALDYIFDKYNDICHYISFVDSDDFVDSCYFEKMLSFIDKNKADISCSSFCFESCDRISNYDQIENDTFFSCFEGTLKLIEDKTIQSHAPCKLYKSFIWKNLRFPINITKMEDQATTFKAFYAAKNGVFVSNYPGYHYWQEGTSICRSPLSNRKIIDSLKAYLEPVNFNFDDYNDFEKEIIKIASQNAFSDVFLMLIGRFNKKSSTMEEMAYVKEICHFVKKNHLIKKYHPALKKTKLKRMVYLYLRPFYSIFYKIFS